MIQPEILRVSVIIPAFKRTDGLCRAVKSLYQTDLPKNQFEVIVVDSSTDLDNQRAIEALMTEAPFELRFFRKLPEGPGPSRNLGAQHARAPILAFFDSDCEATAGWLTAGLAAFEPTIGIVQGQTAPDPVSKLGVFIHTVIVNQENHIYEACNIFYRKQVFEQVGGFPADRDLDSLVESPMGGEDIELAWKVKRSGWKSCFAAGALVYHEVQPITISRWLYSRRLMIWPRVVARIPEVRQHLFARYFYDQAQALFTLGLLGTCLAFFSPWLVLLWGPYVWYRTSETTRTMRGIRRLMRVFPYGLKDAISFCVLVAGSIRFRSPLF